MEIRSIPRIFRHSRLCNLHFLALNVDATLRHPSRRDAEKPLIRNKKPNQLCQCILALIRRTMAQTPSTTTGVSAAKTTPLLTPKGVASG